MKRKQEAFGREDILPYDEVYRRDRAAKSSSAPTDPGGFGMTGWSLACFLALVAPLCVSAGQSGATSAASPVLARAGELTPQEVIDNPQCRMQAARDAAVVVLTESDAARFLVVDTDGPAYGGDLSFPASNYRLGRRADGSLMAGFFGVLTHAAGTIPPPPEPAVIFLDGQVLYEHHDVVLLGIAPDGSSFFAIETVTADSFELLIRNLDQEKEYRYDIGNLFKSWGLELCYWAFYSWDFSEVHLDPGCPGDEGGVGIHYFYKTDGNSAPRIIEIKDRERKQDEAVLVSSTEGYFVEDERVKRDEPKFTVAKRQFDWPEGNARDVWSFITSYNIPDWSISVSSPGAWLTLDTIPSGLPSTWDRKDWRLLVINAATGETVFDFPRVSEEEQRKRLGDFLNPSTVPPGVGNFGGQQIKGNELLIYRSFSRDRKISAYDVYELDTLSDDAKPMFRIPINRAPGNHCASRNYPRKFAERNGRLAYVSSRK